MVGKLRLSLKQEKSIAEANARISIWHGAIRSSKTVASLIRWLTYVADAPRGGQLVVSGKTVETVSRNIFGPLTDPSIVGNDIAKLIKYNRGASTARIIGRDVEVISANDARAEGRLRGMTCAGAYCDELTLFDESFFTQLLGRMSVPGAKLFASTNPGPPLHWVKKQYLNREHEIDLKSWHFTLDDNPSLTEEYKNSIKKEFTGLWYRRMVNGEWCQSDGAIYDMFDSDQHVIKRDEIPPIVQWLGVGLDYGMAAPTAAVLIGVGADKKLYITDEYYYSNKDSHRSKTVNEIAHDLQDFIAKVKVPTTNVHGVRPDYTVIDPSAAALKIELYREGIQTLNAKNDVLIGIRYMSSLFADGKLLVSDTCTNFIEEIQSYSWDESKAEKGLDVPNKESDHLLDACRYVIATLEPMWRSAIQQYSSLS